MNPNEARSVAEFLIADFENEMQTTQRVLAGEGGNGGGVPGDGHEAEA